MPVARNHMEDGELDAVKWTTQIQFEPVFNLGNNMMESFLRLNQAERLMKKFPGAGLRFLRRTYLQGSC